MPDSRLSVPPKGKNATLSIIIVLVLLAAGAAVLTWALYPPDPTPPRPVAQHHPVSPQPKLVEIPTEPAPPPAPVVADAGIDAGGDADVDTKVKRNGKRSRMPEGTIDTRRLTAFIRSKQGQVQQCYERRLKMNNLLQGVLVPEIRIHPSGSVMSVNFSQDTLGDSNVRECVARVIKGWQFPQPQGGAVTVSNPFRFTPRVD